MNDFKKEAKIQYFKYFRFWFIAVGVLLVISIVTGVAHFTKKTETRANLSAPAERVYDYADLLSAEEENLLREYIAKAEKEYKMDFVVVTINQPVEGEEAYAYGCDSTDWTINMMDIADDFWDENGYGYNKNFEGDGSLLLDNRYEGQRGEHLSTSGRVEHKLSNEDIDNVLYAVDDYYDVNPYMAYIHYIDKVCQYVGKDGIHFGIGYIIVAILTSVITAYVYAIIHLKKNAAKNTVAVNAYVVGGNPILQNKDDRFLRKNVTTRRIQNNSSGGGSRGGGGHHTSHSGASHGGGSHRH